MAIQIACRTGSFEPFEARALNHIADLGLKNVEIPVPPTSEIDALSGRLEKLGLCASSMHGECDLSTPDVAQRVADQMPAFAALGCGVMFTSVQRGELEPATAYARLREAGDMVAKHNVTIVIETHPDLATNAGVALETLRGVDHPHVRLNFDTANVYFYNHDVDCVAELEQVVDRLGAVHLKDTDGGYRNWHFPALGEGIVEFPRIFDVLDRAGFSGFCTLEIEGIEGEQRTEDLVVRRIADSIEYLRGLGRL